MKRILIVEDDPVVALIYQRFFWAHGFETAAAPDGAAGLERLKTFVPDAVLLDLMMPKVNGLNLLATIRGEAAWKDLPVLVLTAAAVPMLVQQAVDAGANRVFDKTNDSPLAIVNFLHDVLHTTSEARLMPSAKSGNPDAVLDHWPSPASA